MKRQRVTARKYMGDDAYSWAVFLDGRAVVTGLSRREVPYWRRRVSLDAGIVRCSFVGDNSSACGRPWKEHNFEGSTYLHIGGGIDDHGWQS